MLFLCLLGLSLAPLINVYNYVVLVKMLQIEKETIRFVVGRFLFIRKKRKDKVVFVHNGCRLARDKLCMDQTEQSLYNVCSLTEPQQTR